jgi:nitroreductase/dihydropteridine reductase
VEGKAFTLKYVIPHYIYYFYLKIFLLIKIIKGYKAFRHLLHKMSSFDDGLECRGNPQSSNTSFLNNLEWRRAVKHFGDKPVDTTPIIKAMTNAPSSFGIQPYKIIAVRNPELKKQIRAVAYDQAQVTECDTLFVLCARKDIMERADEYLLATGLESMRGMLTGFISQLPDNTEWAMRQAYIALGFGLAACAELQIPSCPMEGFNRSEVHRILNLPVNLIPCVFLAVGSATENDGRWPRFYFPQSNLIDERN